MKKKTKMKKIVIDREGYIQKKDVRSTDSGNRGTTLEIVRNEGRK